MLFAIKPRRTEPTTFRYMRIAFIPWWVKLPYRVAHWLWETFRAFTETDNTTALTQLLGLFLLSHMVYSLYMGEFKEAATYGLILFLASIRAFFKVLLDTFQEPSEMWHTRKWQDDDSQYHKDE